MYAFFACLLLLFNGSSHGGVGDLAHSLDALTIGGSGDVAIARTAWADGGTLL